MEEKPGMNSTTSTSHEESTNLIKNNAASSKKIAYLHTFLLYLTYIEIGCIASIPGPTLTDLQQILHEDSSIMGIIFTWRSVGLLVGAIAGGVLFDMTKQTVPLIIAFTFLMPLTTIIIPLCRSFSALSWTLFAGGIQISALNTGANVYCLHIWGEGVAPYYQALHFMYASGGLLGPLIAAPFQGKSQGHTNGTDSNNTLHNITCGMLSPNDTTNSTSEGDWLSCQPRIIYAYAIVSLVALVVTILWIVVYCTTSSKVQARNPQEDDKVVKLPGLRFTVLVVGISSILVFCQATMEGGLSQMLAIYAEQDDYGFTEVEATYLTSVYWGTYMFTRGSCILVAYKLNEFAMLGIDIILLLVASLTYVVGTPYSPYCMWIGTAIAGMGLASLYPSTMTWLDKHINVTNKIASVVLFGAAISEIVIPYMLSKYMLVCKATLFYLTLACSVTFGLFFILISIAYKKQGEKYVEHTSDTSGLIQRDSIDQSSDTTMNTANQLLKKRMEGNCNTFEEQTTFSETKNELCETY